MFVRQQLWARLASQAQPANSFLRPAETCPMSKTDTPTSVHVFLPPATIITVRNAIRATCMTSNASYRLVGRLGSLGLLAEPEQAEGVVRERLGIEFIQLS